jgi:hypothetical protein
MAELPKDEPLVRSAFFVFRITKNKMKIIMKKSVREIIFLVLLLLFLSSPSFGCEINSSYATLIYKDEVQLSEFNRKALKNVLCHKKSFALTDEVKSKLDILVEKVVTILLKAWPIEQLQFKIMLLPSDTDIRKIYSEKYGKGGDYIAFYSPKDDTIFISVSDLRQGILAHEIAHVIIKHYFYNGASGITHETLAQLVENHIDE